MKSIPIIIAMLVLIVPLTLMAGDTTPGDPATTTDSRKTTMTQPTTSDSGHDITPLTSDQVSELAARLDPEVFRVTQKSGTERPFCGTLLDNKKDGTYICTVCNLPLFSSQHKFTSGTGWPSFYQEFDPRHVTKVVDSSHGMARTEIECTRCGAHLGHVFDDGPEPTGLRHCLNSASLQFVEEGEELPPLPLHSGYQTAYFAGGCFWGIEHYFQKGPGVVEAVSGYMQGDSERPTYKEVCTGSSGHAEAVKVVFDPEVVSYETLLKAFFMMHDPTQLNRQGPDRGSQYRSGVYVVDEGQLAQASAFIKALDASGNFRTPIVTEVEPASTFYHAEDYHQDYIETTGRSCHVMNPWPHLEQAAKADTAPEPPAKP